MNIKAIRDVIEELQNDFGAGLLSADIYGKADGQSLAGFNSNAKACALFNKVTIDIEAALKGAKFPALGKYYILDLVDDKLIIVVPAGDYQWNMVLDKKHIQLGMVLNIMLPKVLEIDYGTPKAGTGKAVKKEESTAPAETKKEESAAPAETKKEESKSNDDMMPDELSEADTRVEETVQAENADGRCTIDFS